MKTTYKEIMLNSPKGSESSMWESVEMIDKFLDDLPREKTKKLLLDTYIMMNGKHFNEYFAKKEVAKMYHKNTEGTIISGEVYPMQEAEAMEYNKYDVYVGVNAFLHDLGRVDIPKDKIIESAIDFWFEDDDYADENKVFWYFFTK